MANSERLSKNSKQVGGTVKKCIGEYYSGYIQRLMDTGRYLSVSEVLREAMRLHEKHHGEINKDV